MFLPGIFYRAIQIFLIICVIIGLIRWGADSLRWIFGGKAKRDRDEKRAKAAIDNMPVTHPTKLLTSKITDHDDHLDTLITDGKLKEAQDYSREMRAVASEMNDRDGISRYTSYENHIINLMKKQKSSY